MVNLLAERPDGKHECEEFVSVCCGAYELGETGCCGQCKDHAGFECIDCERLKGDYELQGRV